MNRLAVVMLTVACGTACSSFYSPLPDGGCTNQHAACTSNNGTAGDFDAGCPSGSACFPAKGSGCTTGSCAGFCVAASGSGRWSGQCEACGSCTFTTGSIAGYLAPNGCRSTGGFSPGDPDSAGSCDLD